MLNKDIPDSLLEIGGFSLIRVDRDEHSGKGKGGGIGASTTSGAGSTQPKTSCAPRCRTALLKPQTFIFLICSV